ncbi:hypothetical protein ANN_00615 [Periplaneta americana]|uniref:Uncharacterized protein n=1 Tax=Periplaneta americana TaxID=6978 RepID=A0ABQ8TR95_PERAM|nr:hypothetical protein ANN_00615 [Periplaneta americana]
MIVGHPEICSEIIRRSQKLGETQIDDCHRFIYTTHATRALQGRDLSRELRSVIGTHCCERVILVSVQSAASASATEIKDSRMQLRRATSAVHKRAAKCTQADGDIF